jgi:hypothetical protein
MTDREGIDRFVSEIGRCFHAPTRQETDMEYDNRNRGVLFNERDTKAKDDDRDYSGTINSMALPGSRPARRRAASS